MIGWLLIGAAVPVSAVAGSVAIEVPTEAAADEPAAQSTSAGTVRAIEVDPAVLFPALSALSTGTPPASTSQQLLALCQAALELAARAETSASAPQLSKADTLAAAHELIPRMQDARSALLELDNRLLNEQALAAAQPATPPTGAWRSEILAVISRVENGMVILDEGAGSPYDIQNQLRGELVPQGTIETPMITTDWGTPTVAPSDPRYEVEVDGDIGYRSGQSTYAENENVEFQLNERITTRSAKEYGFYQSYTLDRSYVESTELVFGAEQEFPELWWNGKLDLTEEFTQYKDKDEPLNDRQEGLFKLRFDPEWQDGEWQADIDYKYNIKEYETFSERSYLYHSAKGRLTWKINDRLTTEGWSQLDDYNYSIGSTRGNHRVSHGNSWEWQARENLRLDAAVERELKRYDVTKERSYEKLNYEAGVRWQPDDASSIELEGELIDYDAEFDPGDTYKEQRTELRLSRDISEELDASARIGRREKSFDIDPLDDLDSTSYDLGVNYNPSERWNFRADWNLAQYDYALVDRAYEETGLAAGASYSHGDVRASLDWRTSENSYDTDPNRDYSRDDYNFDLDYGFGEHRMRVYYGVGLLDQADPASVNDYTETRMGAEWQFEIDPDVDLRVSYDLSERSYDAQEDIEDSSFAAKLTFEL